MRARWEKIIPEVPLGSPLSLSVIATPREAVSERLYFCAAVATFVAGRCCTHQALGPAPAIGAPRPRVVGGARRATGGCSDRRTVPTSRRDALRHGRRRWQRRSVSWFHNRHRAAVPLGGRRAGGASGWCCKVAVASGDRSMVRLPGGRWPRGRWSGAR
jgi:hypothetical protein